MTANDSHQQLVTLDVIRRPELTSETVTAGTGLMRPASQTRLVENRLLQPCQIGDVAELATQRGSAVSTWRKARR